MIKKRLTRLNCRLNVRDSVDRFFRKTPNLMIDVAVPFVTSATDENEFLQRCRKFMLAVMKRNTKSKCTIEVFVLYS
jgi:hypothetical protein